MTSGPVIRYFGWSGLSLEADGRKLLFDPFFREYCGAKWFSLADFTPADVVCLTHGHEEHFLDAPEIIRATDALVVGSPSVCGFLKWRRRIPAQRLLALHEFESVTAAGFKITAFHWKHRDINLYRALTKAVFAGNATQLSWAWSSATRAPFYSPYVGFHVELPDGRTVLNYNEGFNSKMTDREIEALGRRFRTDVLLAGMQLDFVDDIARGVAALRPDIVVLYPPHDKFHQMMGAVSRPWADFADAARRARPEARIVVAEPGTRLELDAAPARRPAQAADSLSAAV